MPYGYNGRILHVNLTTGNLVVEEPSESFYRMYLGGSAMGVYYLLKYTPPQADPLGPDNTLSLMCGVLTGAPISGQSRVCATAKSPVTGLVGDSQAGGFWPAELKFAGFDGVVIRGKAKRPVYLWVHDGKAELRDATHLWGRSVAEVEDAIREELGDDRIQVLQCGPAAEKGVRFGALINNSNRANGRTGIGTVMASKNLKAVAVRGHGTVDLADPEMVRSLAKWGAEHLKESGVASMSKLGTARIVLSQNEVGGLPTRNWSSGVFEGAEKISGEEMAKTILKGRDTCFGCVVRCKPVVEITNGTFRVDPRYGGPEYETLATMGSYCGVSNLAAICRANQLCNMYGMDTISCGATIAWAMDCFERGLLTKNDTDGVDLRFGNAEAMVQLVEKIGNREGLGRVLGEGSARAAEILGVGKNLIVAVKNHEFPAHMPHVKRSLALIYTVNPFGPDHQSHEHDPCYEMYSERMAELGLLNPQPSEVLNAEKVRYSLYTQYAYSLLDSVCVCQFVFGPSFQLYSLGQLVDVVRAVTGWNVTLWELIKAGERRLNLMQMFNSRENSGRESDMMPAKLLTPLTGGPTDGITISNQEVEIAKALYFQIAGWDSNGHPTRGKLVELGLEWLTTKRY